MANEEFTLVGSDEKVEENGVEKPHRPRPDHVLQAILRGDRSALSQYGTKGNTSPIRVRKNKIKAMQKLADKMVKAQQKAEAKRLAKAQKAEAKLIASREKAEAVRIAAEEKARAELEAAIELDVFLWGLRQRQARRQLLKDARAHAEANLAGSSED